MSPTPPPKATPASYSAALGFTLIEAMIVVAIIGVVTSLAGIALSYGMGRARLKNASFEITALTSAAQIRANSTGVPNYIVFYQGTTEFGVMHLQGSTEPDLATWGSVDVDKLYGATSNNTQLPVVGWQLIDQLVLSRSGSIAFAPLSGFSSSTTFTQAVTNSPFRTVNLTAPGGNGLGAACNFCVAASGGWIGALRFSPDGTMRASPNNPALTSALLGIQINRPDESLNPKLFAFGLPSGLVKVFDR